MPYPSLLILNSSTSGIDLYPIQEEKGKESRFCKGSRSRRVVGGGGGGVGGYKCKTGSILVVI